MVMENFFMADGEINWKRFGESSLGVRSCLFLRIDVQSVAKALANMYLISDSCT